MAVGMCWLVQVNIAHDGYCIVADTSIKFHFTPTI